MNRTLIVIALCIPLFTGCGGVEAQATAPGDAINAMVASGQLPDLDTSDSLAGPDVDGNGVRDDIDKIIDSKNLTQPQRRAVKQLARAAQSMLGLETAASSAIYRVDADLANAMGCVRRQIGQNASNEIIREVEKYTMNTLARIKSYQIFNKLSVGAPTVFVPGGVCDE